MRPKDISVPPSVDTDLLELLLPAMLVLVISLWGNWQDAVSVNSCRVTSPFVTSPLIQQMCLHHRVRKKSTSSECNFFANKIIFQKLWHFHRQNLFSWGNHGNLKGLRCTLHHNQHFDGMIFQNIPAIDKHRQNFAVYMFPSQLRRSIFGIHTGGKWNG